MSWHALPENMRKSRSPAHIQKLRSFQIFSFFFLKQKLEKEKWERDSMGLPVPVHPQLSYPVSLVNVTHRESKYAAVTSVEKL